MKPYASGADWTIWHGDCRAILLTLDRGSVDAVVTDPPWIASIDKISRPKSGVAASVVDSKTLGYGDIGHFSSDAITECQRIAVEDCLFIVGYKELGEVCRLANPLRGVFAWKKHGGLTVTYPAAMDLAFVVWTGAKSRLYGYQHWKSSVFDHAIPTAGCISNGERVLQCANGPAAHPAQGPLSLYMELVQPLGDSILDPFLGTGTTGVACIRTGRKFIGIEIEERYCEIAARRISQAEPALFLEAAKQRQLELTEAAP